MSIARGKTNGDISKRRRATGYSRDVGPDDVVAPEIMNVVELAAIETLPDEVDIVLGRGADVVAAPITVGVMDEVALAVWDVGKISVV